MLDTPLTLLRARMFPSVPSVVASRLAISLQLLARGNIACDAEPKTSTLTCLFLKRPINLRQALTILWLQGSAELEILRYSMTLWSEVCLLSELIREGCVINVTVSISVTVKRVIVSCFNVCYRWNRCDVRLAPRLLLSENIVLLVGPI